MNKVFNIIKKYATKKIISFFLFLTIVGVIALTYSNYTFSKIMGVSSTLDLSFFYSINFANEFFTNITQDGIKYYLSKFAIVDTLFPLSYCIFFTLLVAYILKNKNLLNEKLKYLTLFPLIPMFFDYIENLSTIILMVRTPNINNNLIYLLTVSSWIKWGSAMIGVFILIRLFFNKINR